MSLVSRPHFPHLLDGNLFQAANQALSHAELKAGALAEAMGDMSMSFAHLVRAHVPGQASTGEHVRVHVRMLAWTVKQRDAGEALGQMMRIVGAATITAFGLVPHGNTGGATSARSSRCDSRRPGGNQLAGLQERAVAFWSDPKTAHSETEVGLAVQPSWRGQAARLRWARSASQLA
jgi:hypothetical protein